MIDLAAIGYGLAALWLVLAGLLTWCIVTAPLVEDDQ